MDGVRGMKPRACFMLVVLGILLEIGASGGSPVSERESALSLIRGKARRQRQSSQAYATLLYGDEFLLGVRVLGKSIRDTGADKDMVALVSKGVSPELWSCWRQTDG